MGKRKVWAVLVALIAVAGVSSAVGAFSKGDAGSGVGQLVLAAAIAFGAYKLWTSKPKEKSSAPAPSGPSGAFSPVKVVQFEKNRLEVDDVSSQFSVSCGKGKSRVSKIYKYSDLLNYELNEDGSSVLSGKGLSAAVGAVTFGVVGAMVGASGARHSSQTCTSLCVRLSVNDLSAPLVTFPFVTYEVKRDSPIYRNAMSSAKEFMATLDYIAGKNTVAGAAEK